MVFDPGGMFRSFVRLSILRRRRTMLRGGDCLGRREGSRGLIVFRRERMARSEASRMELGDEYDLESTRIRTLFLPTKS